MELSTPYPTGLGWTKKFISRKGAKLKTASIADPAHTSYPCRADAWIEVGPSQPIDIRRFMHGKWPISGLKVLFLGAICNKEARYEGDEKTEHHKIVVFESKKIRRIWREEEWYFSETGRKRF